MAGHAAELRLGIALAVVFALKLFIGLPLGGHPLLAPSGVAADLQGLDSDYYLHFAGRVRAGDVWLLESASFFGQPAPAFFISPLYIYTLALFLVIGGGSLAFVHGAQLALGVAAVWLVMQTARRWYGDRAAWIAGALMAGCGLFTFYESLILQASLDPFLTALDLYTLTRALQDGRRRDWAAAGAALGLHALNRPNVLIVAAAVMLAAAVDADAVPLRVPWFPPRAPWPRALRPLFLRVLRVHGSGPGARRDPQLPRVGRAGPDFLRMAV